MVVVQAFASSGRSLIVSSESDGHAFVPAQHAEEARAQAGWTDPLGELAATAFSVNVTNTGSVDSDEVVLGFLTPPGAGQNGVALKTLFGFQRVHVKAGETPPATRLFSTPFKRPANRRCPWTTSSAPSSVGRVPKVAEPTGKRSCTRDTALTVSPS